MEVVRLQEPCLTLRAPDGSAPECCARVQIPPLAVWVFQQVGKGAGLWSERFLQGWSEEAEGLHNETGCCHLETADLVR